MVAWAALIPIAKGFLSKYGVQLAGSALSLAGTKGQADAEEKTEQAYAEYQAKTKQAALENYRYQTRALHNRYAEEQEASAYEAQQIHLQNMQAKATAQASAASSGITGSTIDNLFNDYERAAAQGRFLAARNLQLKGYQMEDEIDAAWIQANNTINLQQQYTGTGTTGVWLQGIGSTLTQFSNSYAKTNASNSQGLFSLANLLKGFK